MIINVCGDGGHEISSYTFKVVCVHCIICAVCSLHKVFSWFIYCENDVVDNGLTAAWGVRMDYVSDVTMATLANHGTPYIKSSKGLNNE